ncbi:CRISPR-associated endonuclease Cas2 [Vibrio sp. WXL210]|uniref:CRISPR-associated endonuclease Cas2 n=1 Tax=Vibrio sp. WXL210 TaxID=3450709 RepID=UPI003EC5E5AD
MRALYVICYDISDDKIRRYVERRLACYGLRVQYSVFECLLTPSQLVRLRQQLCRYIDPETDALHYFSLCKHCVSKRLLHGKALPFSWQSHEWVG